MRLLSRGEAEEPAPDALVELEYVRLFEGPMLLRVLENAGVHAQGLEATDIATEATSTTRMRILVRYADVPRATAALEDHRRQLRNS